MPEKPFPIIGAIYSHKKGNDYIVLGLAHHTEVNPELILYTLYRKDLWGRFTRWLAIKAINMIFVIWARPVDMFMDGRFTLNDYRLNKGA